MNTSFNLNDQNVLDALVMFNGTLAQIISKKGNWVTLKTESGEEVKARSGQHKLATPEEIAQFKCETARGEEYFIGQKNRKKVVKIGDTEASIANYFVSNIKTPCGRRTLDCADSVASSLRGLNLDEVYETTSEWVKIPVVELEIRYSHLNPGMQRMNLGNLIRGAMKKHKKEAAAKSTEG